MFSKVLKIQKVSLKNNQARNKSITFIEKKEDTIEKNNEKANPNIMKSEIPLDIF